MRCGMFAFVIWDEQTGCFWCGTLGQSLCTTPMMADDPDRHVALLAGGA
jgi:hypothetical protein